MIRLLLLSLLISTQFFCKPSAVDQFDRMKREASFWRLARFCAENEKELQSRDEECKAAFLSSEKQLQRIFQRQMDLSFAKLRIPKGEAEEIESLLRAKTEFGIRYWEIWKQTVIFE